MEIGLSNVRVEQARIEDIRDKANTVISRAFTAPEPFLQVVDKNCITSSRVIIMLGSADRLPDKLPNGFELVDMQRVIVPAVESERHVAVR